MDTIIIDQISIFLKNNFKLELLFKKPGSTRIKIATKKIIGNI